MNLGKYGFAIAYDHSKIKMLNMAHFLPLVNKKRILSRIPMLWYKISIRKLLPCLDDGGRMDIETNRCGVL